MNAPLNPPTIEQSAILSAYATTPDNLMLNAYAGCGKTSTLEMLERASKVRPILYLTFNRRNADEATERLGSGSTTVRTFNSLGHRVWASYVISKLTLNAKKSADIFRELVGEMRKADAAACWDRYFSVMDGVTRAKSLGYIPDGHSRTGLLEREDLHNAMEEIPDELTAGLIDAVLNKSIEQARSGIIDYNDQIYMPTLFGGTFPKFPVVMVDEYQDLAPINHAMVRKLVSKRLIGVGDPYQNIYGFRGAKASGMQSAIEQYSMTSLPLSVSFRCPSAIVLNARWRVPNFQWLHDGGHVETLTEGLDGTAIPDTATIICRNNAPLFRIAFKLLAVGKSVSVVGSELGPRVVGIMKKLGDESMRTPQVLTEIESWREEKLKAESKTANDTADCMRVFAEHGTTLGSAIKYAELLFSSNGTIRLLTGHKSKGLEFTDVYFLDPWLCSDTEQDRNLRYVIQTRSRQNLFTIDSRQIRW